MLKQIIPLINNFLAIDTSSVITDYQGFSEKNEYDACSFKLENKRIIYRKAKITPKKIGQFIAIWKRNPQGTTEPYAMNDDFDYMVIACESGSHKGVFIFSKEVLSNLGIISTNLKEGKRGMRVYPTWDEPTNKQAINTQNKQRSSFRAI